MRPPTRNHQFNTRILNESRKKKIHTFTHSESPSAILSDVYTINGVTVVFFQATGNEVLVSFLPSNDQLEKRVSRKLEGVSRRFMSFWSDPTVDLPNSEAPYTTCLRFRATRNSESFTLLNQVGITMILLLCLSSEIHSYQKLSVERN